MVGIQRKSLQSKIFIPRDRPSPCIDLQGQLPVPFLCGWRGKCHPRKVWVGERVSKRNGPRSLFRGGGSVGGVSTFWILPENPEGGFILGVLFWGGVNLPETYPFLGPSQVILRPKNRGHTKYLQNGEKANKTSGDLNRSPYTPYFWSPQLPPCPRYGQFMPRIRAAGLWPCHFRHFQVKKSISPAVLKRGESKGIVRRSEIKFSERSMLIIFHLSANLRYRHFLTHFGLFWGPKKNSEMQNISKKKQKMHAKGPHDDAHVICSRPE